VTWVPLSRRRRARRGFDQAEVLARGVAAAIELPTRRLLVRRRNTAEQARRAARDRRSALRDAFASTRPVSGAVLLVDDVLTTGSTAAACAAALKRSGAERVDVLVAARSLRNPAPARCFARGPLMPGSVR
jgi:predicted amidophosphoribosyltransferase